MAIWIRNGRLIANAAGTALLDCDECPPCAEDFCRDSNPAACCGETPTSLDLTIPDGEFTDAVFLGWGTVDSTGYSLTLDNSPFTGSACANDRCLPYVYLRDASGAGYILKVIFQAGWEYRESTGQCRLRVDVTRHLTGFPVAGTPLKHTGVYLSNWSDAGECAASYECRYERCCGGEFVDGTITDDGQCEDYFAGGMLTVDVNS